MMALQALNIHIPRIYAKMGELESVTPQLPLELKWFERTDNRTDRVEVMPNRSENLQIQ